MAIPQANPQQALYKWTDPNQGNGYQVSSLAIKFREGAEAVSAKTGKSVEDILKGGEATAQLRGNGVVAEAFHQAAQLDHIIVRAEKAASEGIEKGLV